MASRKHRWHVQIFRQTQFIGKLFPLKNDETEKNRFISGVETAVKKKYNTDEDPTDALLSQMRYFIYKYFFENHMLPYYKDIVNGFKRMKKQLTDDNDKHSLHTLSEVFVSYHNDMLSKSEEVWMDDSSPKIFKEYCESMEILYQRYVIDYDKTIKLTRMSFMEHIARLTKKVSHSQQMVLDFDPGYTDNPMKSFMEMIGIPAFILLVVWLLVFAILISFLAYFVFVIWIIIGILMAFIAYRINRKKPLLYQLYTPLMAFAMGPWYLVWIVFVSMI